MVGVALESQWSTACARNAEGVIEIFLFYGPIVVSLILSVLAIVIMIVVMVRRAYVNSNTQPEKEPLVRSTAKKHW